MVTINRTLSLMLQLWKASHPEAEESWLCSRTPQPEQYDGRWTPGASLMSEAAAGLCKVADVA